MYWFTASSLILQEILLSWPGLLPVGRCENIDRLFPVRHFRTVIDLYDVGVNIKVFKINYLIVQLREYIVLQMLDCI